MPSIHQQKFLERISTCNTLEYYDSCRNYYGLRLAAAKGAVTPPCSLIRGVAELMMEYYGSCRAYYTFCLAVCMAAVIV